MKFRPLALIVSVACLCLWVAGEGAHADEFQIEEVIFEGNERIDSEALRIQLEHRSGSISSTGIEADLKNLYRTGFFEDVRAVFVPSKGSAQRGKLKYVLRERKTIRKVFIRGNEELDEEDLAEALQFGSQRYLVPKSVDSAVKAARALYESKGYFDADISYSTLAVGENEVDLTFQVEEGKKYRISEVVFRGLQELDASDLRDIMETRRYKWYNSWLFGTGRLNRDVLDIDRKRLQQFCLDKGLIDATISEALIEKKDDGINVVFDIDEGPVYRIGEVSASGDLINESVEETLGSVESTEGEIFNATQLRDDSFRIGDAFGDLGYAFANVVPETSVNRADQIVDVRFSVDKGKEVSINKVKIEGNQKTYDRVIRRELVLDEQQKYNRSKLERSEKLIRRLGYFEEVDLSTETIPGQDDEVNLLLKVREASTGTFSIGAGFSSADGALFNTRLSENNVLGTGRRVVLNVDFGSRRENFVLSLQDRRLYDSFVSGSIDGYKTEREFSDFDRDLAGGGFSLGYPLERVFGEWWEDVNFSTRYEYLEIDIFNIDTEDAAQFVIDSEGRSSSSSITPSLSRNTIDNPLNPTSGSRQSLSIELAGLGGTEEYFLLEAAQQYYTPVYKSSIGEFVFSWRTRLGYGETYDGDDFPLFKRYFPGGINSVRGFEVRTLGPTDEDGNEFGGSKQLVNNLELIFPLVQSAGLRGVIFYDVGEAFDDDETIALGDLRQAVGYGIRWTSPLGPIRVEFGHPIDREEGEDSIVTLFSFGAPL